MLQIPILLTLFLPLLLDPSASASDQTSLDAPPPGLVLLKGGKAKVGSDSKKIRAMIAERAEVANSLVSETPLHTVDVDDFYLMTTEVTNEQYAEFVSATGAKPPMTWGEEAINAGLDAWQKEQAGLRKAAIDAGERPPARTPFDSQAWWDDNWEGSDWKVPLDKLDHPVVYVTYYDVETYARWAGLRPMSEVEYQYAARGDNEQLYPWGDQWDDKLYCSSFHLGVDRSQPVGSFEKGAANGVYDLVGNVWEWTSSPFVAYPRYEPIKVEIGRGKQARPVEGLAPWDPNQRVAVGGSFKNDSFANRITTRRNTDRTQSADALGFRCAADVQPGRDTARWLVEDDVQFKVLPQDTEFYIDRPIVLQRWLTKQPEGERPESYGIVAGYERILFVPALEAPGASTNNLADQTEKNGPVVLGLLTTSVDMLEPKLSPGTYYVAWRTGAKLDDRGDADEGEDAQRPPLADFDQAAGFVAEQASFLFFDLAGAPVASVPSGVLLYERMKDPGRVELLPWVEPEVDEETLEDPEYVPPTPMDTLRFHAAVAGKHKSKGFLFDLDLKVTPDSIDESWRR